MTGYWEIGRRCTQWDAPTAQPDRARLTGLIGCRYSSWFRRNRHLVRLLTDFRLVFPLPIVEPTQSFAAADPGSEAIHIKIDDRRCVERQHLAHHKTAHYGNPQRATQF